MMRLVCDASWMACISGWICSGSFSTIRAFRHRPTRFRETFARVWHGDAENDGFNRLVLAAGLHWRQVAMLRGYCKYLLQTGVPFSQAYVEGTFARYPLLARLLVELFEARFGKSAVDLG